MKAIVLLFSLFIVSSSFVQISSPNSTTEVVSPSNFELLWSYSDGVAAGKYYRSRNAKNVFDASYEYAMSVGQTEYARGLYDGWIYVGPPYYPTQPLQSKAPMIK